MCTASCANCASVHIVNCRPGNLRTLFVETFVPTMECHLEGPVLLSAIENITRSQKEIGPDGVVCILSRDGSEAT